MNTVCVRLTRGEDLLQRIQKTADENKIKSAVVLSAVGCLSEAVIRDADGLTVVTVKEPCEIVSLMGTVSGIRTHLHIALSKSGLDTIGGHLLPGCIINTTCELVLGILEGWEYSKIEDPQTGYDEIEFRKL